MLRYLHSALQDVVDPSRDVVPLPSDLDARLKRVETKLNALLGLVVVLLLLPLAGALWASVKWLLLIGPLIVLCLALAMFRHRIPSAMRSAWRAITDPAERGHSQPRASATTEAERV